MSQITISRRKSDTPILVSGAFKGAQCDNACHDRIRQVMDTQRGCRMSIETANKALRGLSIGDGYGQRQGELILRRSFSTDLPPAPWRWTDDTAMAISVVESLREHGEIDQDRLARRFAERHALEPNRGYAGQAAALLMSISSGLHWSEANISNFPEGSYGNGAAMRSAPLGAFFAGEPVRAAEQAALASEITHAHPEGIAGGIAVAVAASINASSPDLSPQEFIDTVALHTPESATRANILKAKDFDAAEVDEAVAELGAGWEISSQDTVPFCMFIASHYRGRFEAGLMFTAAVGGDCDTTCAIVGGILAAGPGELPASWIERAEPVPQII